MNVRISGDEAFVVDDSISAREDGGPPYQRRYDQFGMTICTSYATRPLRLSRLAFKRPEVQFGGTGGLFTFRSRCNPFHDYAAFLRRASSPAQVTL